MTGQVRIATRRSRLALWQAEHVAARLTAAHPGLVVSLLPIVTEGDRIQDRTLAAVGGKGLFIKELETAMLAGDADIAVHSMKDMPAVLPPCLVIGAALERADPRDAFISLRHDSFESLPQGARIGTSSLRRQSQLRHARPDLEILVLRGNVETRLRKLDAGEFDATVLATAGLERLGLGDRIRERLSPQQMLPAVGQGVIGIECMEANGQIRALLAPLDHAATRCRLEAERAFAGRLGGSCQSPIAAYAELTGDSLNLRGLVASPDGATVFADGITGAAREAATLGTALANRLLDAGAGALLEALAMDGHDMARLTGIGVLVTRPEHQAEHLCQLIEAEGGAAVRYPALVIKARPDRAAVRAAIGPADRYDLIIFISANSVRFGADFLDQRHDVPIAAVGQPTAAALNAAGFRVSLMPAEGAGSEELLAMPQLAQMAGKRVLILRGSGGRELLSEVLTARGALVQYAEVYTREPARPSAQLQSEIELLWRQGGIRAYAATSVELLEALVGIVTPRCRELMDSTALVTGSRRVAEAAARLGLGSPIVLADSPADAALTGALIRWREANMK